MKITLEAEERGLNGEKPHPVEIVLSLIGSEAWVRLTVGGKDYDVDYREFWDGARAICIGSF